MNLPPTLSRRRLLAVIFVGFAIALALFFYFNSKEPVQTSSASPTQSAAAVPKPEQASHGLPVRLEIPNIKVDATVEYVGLTPQGDMDVPKVPEDVAWYKLGPRPGEEGSSVIAGHFGWINGTPAAFDNLHKLQKGDKLSIEDDSGTITSFVVRESRSFDPKADASSVFGSNDGKAHLNLITCEGVWNKTQKGYSKRLVVFTDKVL